MGRPFALKERACLLFYSKRARLPTAARGCTAGGGEASLPASLNISFTATMEEAGGNDLAFVSLLLLHTVTLLRVQEGKGLQWELHLGGQHTGHVLN